MRVYKLTQVAAVCALGLGLLVHSAARAQATDLSDPSLKLKDSNFLAADEGTIAPDPRPGVLKTINDIRHAAGLSPVILDADASEGCMEHANYMALNLHTSAMVGLNAHKQDPSLPGATPAGAICAQMADLYPGVKDLDAAVRGWMASLYHRRPILDPGLKRIGIGYAPVGDGWMMAALMFIPGSSSDSEWPINYPADGQTDVPLSMGPEIPNPVPDGQPAGYPITLQFPPFEKITNVTVSVQDQAGTPVPIYLSTPEQPATSFGQYGVICAIPKDRLAPLTLYQVDIHATWTDDSGAIKDVHKIWSFRTMQDYPG